MKTQKLKPRRIPLNATPFFLFLALFLPSLPATFAAEAPVPPLAEPVILYLKDRTYQPGRLLSLDPLFCRAEIDLAEGKAKAAIAVPKQELLWIEFPEAEKLYEKMTGTGDLLACANLWGKWKNFLSAPRSPAAKFGLQYASLLSSSGNSLLEQRAAEICAQIEKESWDTAARAEARRGRLRAWIATGNAASAVAEAEEIAASSEDPQLLIEAKWILAFSSAKDLDQFLANNPKWKDDPFASPKKNALFETAIDGFLYPFLFFGSEATPSARGLWNAAELCAACGEDRMAKDFCDDLLGIYPETSYAGKARDFLVSRQRQ